MKLEGLHRDSFAARVGERFRVEADGEAPFDAELVHVTSLGDARGPGGRTPFSLLLAGPAHGRPAQRTFRVRHDALGSFVLFLVPIGPGADGRMRWEAVFT